MVLLHIFLHSLLFYICLKTSRNKSVFFRLVFKFRTDKAIYRLFESLHLKKHQNFKDDMTNEYSIESNTLKKRDQGCEVFCFA